MQKIIEWEKVFSTRYCPPHEEHSLPLHVCLGMVNSQAKLIIDDNFLGKRAVAFL